MNKMEQAFALFDAFNQQDPKQIEWEGAYYPSEYFYALQLYNWVKRLEPGAGETLLLASRCQHIGRWHIARSEYPEGKAGYFKWRTELAKFHADKAGELMREAGYGPEEITAVQRILLKTHIHTDREVQVMENALCLVFLQFQYEDFLRDHEEEKVIRILQRSWKKMSGPGREAALGLTFSVKGKELIGKAVGPA